ncbi:MAG TPA: NAD(P)-dependent oxidoreductase [Nocardioidaceae bacterium]|nr:NAD(P)-dependent oxidoreductase [Nocardioidaceae bacterium]
MSTLRPGVIGLGMIGGGVAVSLAKSGRPATAVYDVRPGVSTELDGVPDQVDSPGAVAAESDVILLAVVSADQARDVLAGDSGVLSKARAGQIVVLLSTVSLESVRELAALCNEHEVALLDAGVTGGTQAATNGLVTMVGGPDEAVEKARPVLEDFSKAVIHCGPLGAGMVTKLARNAITYSMWAAVREATGLAAAGGVAPKKLLEVLESADDSVSPLLHLQLLAVDYKIGAEQREWAEGIADKDLAAAQELANELGLELPIVEQVRPRMPDVYGGTLDEPEPA